MDIFLKGWKFGSFFDKKNGNINMNLCFYLVSFSEY